METPNPLNIPDPIQMTIYPSNGEELFFYIQSLLSWFEAVTFFHTDGHPINGILLDVSSDNIPDQREGLRNLRDSGLRYKLSNLDN